MATYFYENLPQCKILHKEGKKTRQKALTSSETKVFDEPEKEIDAILEQYGESAAAEVLNSTKRAQETANEPSSTTKKNLTPYPFIFDGDYQHTNVSIHAREDRNELLCKTHRGALTQGPCNMQHGHHHVKESVHDSNVK